jgi:hypothetical protein
VKASNIRGIWSPVIPIPVSYTSMRILGSVCRQPTRRAATTLCVFDGIADQVAQNGAEKQSIALNR